MEILDIVIQKKKKTTEETNYRHINTHTFYTEQFQNVQIKIKARSIVFLKGKGGGQTNPKRNLTSKKRS